MCMGGNGNIIIAMRTTRVCLHESSPVPLVTDTMQFIQYLLNSLTHNVAVIEVYQLLGNSQKMVELCHTGLRHTHMADVAHCVLRTSDVIDVDVYLTSSGSHTHSTYWVNLVEFISHAVKTENQFMGINRKWHVIMQRTAEKKKKKPSMIRRDWDRYILIHGTALPEINNFLRPQRLLPPLMQINDLSPSLTTLYNRAHACDRIHFARTYAYRIYTPFFFLSFVFARDKNLSLLSCKAAGGSACTDKSVMEFSVELCALKQTTHRDRSNEYACREGENEKWKEIGTFTRVGKTVSTGRTWQQPRPETAHSDFTEKKKRILLVLFRSSVGYFRFSFFLSSSPATAAAALPFYSFFSHSHAGSLRRLWCLNKYTLVNA